MQSVALFRSILDIRNTSTLSIATGEEDLSCQT